MENGSILISSKFTTVCGTFCILMGQSSNYYPQGNGFDKSNKKYLVQIIQKIVSTNQRGWNKKLLNALWARKITLDVIHSHQYMERMLDYHYI